MAGQSRLVKAIKALALVIAAIALLIAFVRVGDLVSGTVPTRYHVAIETVAMVIAIAATLYLILKQQRGPVAKWKTYALVTIALLAYSLAVWFHVDDGCDVDWDGRRNATVCE